MQLFSRAAPGFSVRGQLEEGKAQEEEHLSFCDRIRFYGQATKGVCVDALAQTGDEGRGQLR